jgi:L-arabinose isomerase
MIIERRVPLTARVGLVGVGHHVYWNQFEGLHSVMLKKMETFKQKIIGHGVEAIDFGLLDNSETAYRALESIKKADIDLLFIDMVTYATSATFAPLIQALNVPIVLVALQPLKTMDYAQGTTFIQLCNDDFCAVPEFCSVAVKMGKKPPPVVLGVLEGDHEADRELQDWCRIAHVLHDLKTARIGLMGHVLECMYDMYVDPSLITRTFGCHVVQVEPHDIYRFYRNPDPAAIDAMITRIQGFFDTPSPVSDNITFMLKEEDLNIAARAAVALERAIDELNLTGLAYYYEGEEGSELRTMVTNFIVGNSLLTAAGFPMCGEFDLKTCMAMLIMDRLEIGGSFAEFHPMNFNTNSILVGHDGPHHINIADRKPVLRSLSKYHGKPGSGAGVEFKIKEGPLTMLGITTNAEDKLKFVIAEGESLQGDIPPTGNTNTHGYFKPDLKTFLKRWLAEGPAHHFALGIGHHGDDLVKIANALNIDYTKISSN